MIWYILLGFVAGVVALSLLLPTTRRVWVFHLYAFKQLFVWLGRVITRRPYARPVAARHFCEDMGPTFLKFGQIVASSAGMFPDRYVAEFQKCLDRVRPFEFETVRATIERELGAERAARLTDLDPVPLASASIAQVHVAKLDGTTDVVIKVQRPGITARIAADMKIMRFAAGLAERLVRDAELANPVGVVDDLAVTLNEEIDFRKEAKNLDEFNEIMRELGHGNVRAPTPYWDFTTREVLVMERFYGTRVDHIPQLDREVDAEDKLVAGVRAWFQCVMLYGFFHGDVHAGNLMLLDDDSLGFLDFGIVGRFDEKQKDMVTDYVIAFATGDYKNLGKIIAEMGGVADDIDMAGFVADLEGAYKPLLSKSFGELNFASLIPDIHRVATKHRMKMPKEFILITKQMLYFDRYAKILAPSLNIFTDPRLIGNLMMDVQKARMLRDKARAGAATP